MIKRKHDWGKKQLRLYNDEGIENQAVIGKQNMPLSYWLMYIQHFKGDKIIVNGASIWMGYTIYEWQIV